MNQLDLRSKLINNFKVTTNSKNKNLIVLNILNSQSLKTNQHIDC